MTQATRPPAPPAGINHLVLNVRDLERSHRFWTEVVGLCQVGELRPSAVYPDPPRMRFYAGVRDGQPNHHDIALVEKPELPEPPADWTLYGAPSPVNHIAISFPDRDSWLAHLAYLRSIDVPFHRRVDHGMTHSLYLHDPDGYGVELLYELPRKVWEGDIDAALNHIEPRPTEGAAALEDDADNVPVFGPPA